MNDLFYFFVVVTNFVFAFGVAVHAINFPEEEFTLKAFIKIFDIAYWPIYGEIKVLELLDECIDSDSCETTSYIVSFLIIMFYMAISSILLINILIAIFRFENSGYLLIQIKKRYFFSNTFEKIQTNSDTVWKNQRYELIREYIEYSPVPSPLNIIYRIWSFFFKAKKEKNENNNFSIKSNFCFLKLKFMVI